MNGYKPSTSSGRTELLLYSCRINSVGGNESLAPDGAIANVAPHLAALEMDGVGDFVGALLRPLHHGAERSNA